MVCTDQWLVTHVDPAWPVSQLKQVLAQKFSKQRVGIEKNQRSIPVSPHKTRRRSLSPITFAAPRKPRPVATENAPSVTSAEGRDAVGDAPETDSDDEDDDEVVDVNKALSEAHRYKYNTRPSTSTISDTLSRHHTADTSAAAQEAEQYVLITFSTTQILEDRFSLEWYGIHPGELLELHPLAVSLVSLPRFSLDAYISPYFAARVWALRVVGHALDSTLRDIGVPRDHQTDDEIPDSTPRSPLLRDKSKKKITLEWKERWAVIHQGIFSLCKERHDTHAAFSAPLSSMLAIRDSTHFDLPLRSSRRTRSLPTQNMSSSGPDIVCVKFSDVPPPRHRTMSHDSLAVPFERHSSEASSPPSQSAWWRRGSRDASTTLSSSLASSASALMGSPSGSGLAEMWDALARRGSRTGLDDSECEGEDAVWIVLDMLTGAACSHILRVLHRHAPPTCDSSFLPDRPPSRSVPSPIVFNTRTSSPFSPSDLPTPGPSSAYTFPPPTSPLLSSSPTTDSYPLSPPPNQSDSAYPFPNPSLASAPPTRPVTPARPPPLRIDTTATEHSVPYPDWRLALTRKARRAGLGAVGRAMELVMFGDEECEDDEDDEEDELAIEWARRLSALEASPLEYPPRSRSRPRPGRHVSDPAVPFGGGSQSTATGEFDAPVPIPLAAEDSDESEAEWEGWLDAAIAQRRRERPASRRIHRTDTLETAVPGDLYWGTGEEWHAGRGSRTGSPSPAYTTPENECADPWAGGRSREPSGSDAEADTGTEGDGSSAHSIEPSGARPSSYYGYFHWQPVPSSRGRRVKRGMAAMDHGGRTLSSYSSADSLLKRTMRTAIGGSGKAQVKRASVSSAELHLQLGNAAAEAPPPRSASASPPLSRPSLASMRSAGSARSHPLSPLCGQMQDSRSTPGHYEETRQPRHPIPLPGMPMVPSGYTTFRHSALYGRRAAARGSSPMTATAGAGAAAESESEEPPHAGLVHGQSMQRIPVPMSMMMTTVSSTVSVGPGKAGGATR